MKSRQLYTTHQPSNAMCPLYNSIKDKFQTLYENVLLLSITFKSFFQLDHEVDISLYIMEATTLRHPTKLANLKPSWCIICPISLLASRTLKSISLYFISFRWRWSLSDDNKQETCKLWPICTKQRAHHFQIVVHLLIQLDSRGIRILLWQMNERCFTLDHRANLRR